MSYWVFWLILGISLLHVFEEYAWPGGFIPWMKQFSPRVVPVLTRDVAVIINVGFLSLVLLAALLVRISPLFSLSVISLLGWNAVLHLLGSLKTKRYSPGLVTAILLYIPAVLWTFSAFIATEAISVRNMVLAILLGATYQAFPLLYFALAGRKTKTN